MQISEISKSPQTSCPQLVHQNLSVFREDLLEINDCDELIECLNTSNHQRAMLSLR